MYIIFQYLNSVVPEGPVVVVCDAVHDVHFRPRNTVDGPVQRVLASPEDVPVVETLPCLIQGNKTLKTKPQFSYSTLFNQVHDTFSLGITSISLLRF